ncbi:hypothetical protein H0X06_04025 [Candidatus Dependentiae bacterium]|nr:hypothetical protein [Candidatus Dependentiae bacterium]
MMNNRERDLSSLDALEKAFFRIEFARIAVQERMIIKIGLYSFAAASILWWFYYFVIQTVLYGRLSRPLSLHDFKFIVVVNLILLFLWCSVFLIVYLGIRYKKQHMHELYKEYSRLGNVKEDPEIMWKK